MEHLQSHIIQIVAKYKYESILISISVIIAMISLLLFGLNQSSTSTAPDIHISDQAVHHKDAAEYIYADISGSVNEPGVYQLLSGERLIDLIKKANGLSEEADKSYFRRNFNLAKEIKDGEKVYVPSEEEVNGMNANKSQNAALQQSLTQQTLGASSKIIDINTASLEELDTLPGVGKVTAEKIISSRPYKAIEELLNKKIIKKNIYEGIKTMVNVN